MTKYTTYNSLKHGDVSMNQKNENWSIMYISFEIFFLLSHFAFSSKTEQKKNLSILHLSSSHFFKKII